LIEHDTPTQPTTELDRLTSEVNRRRQRAAELQAGLADAERIAADISMKIEAAEDDLIRGKIDLPALEDLRQRHTEAVLKTTRIPSELRTERRLLEKAQGYLDAEVTRAELARWQQVNRQIYLIFAPLLQALCVAFLGAREIDGFARQFHNWAAREFEHLSTSSRFARANVANIMRQLLAGDGAAVADFIHDLQSAAPDLVTEPMRDFLRWYDFWVNERFRQQTDHAAQLSRARSTPAELLKRLAEPLGTIFRG